MSDETVRRRQALREAGTYMQAVVIRLNSGIASDRAPHCRPRSKPASNDRGITSSKFDLGGRHRIASAPGSRRPESGEIVASTRHAPPASYACQMKPSAVVPDTIGTYPSTIEAQTAVPEFSEARAGWGRRCFRAAVSGARGQNLRVVPQAQGGRRVGRDRADAGGMSSFGRGEGSRPSAATVSSRHGCTAWL